MKKYLKLLPAFAIMMTTGIFTSCGDDDDTPDIPDTPISQNALAGIWRESDEPADDAEYLVISSDGTIRSLEYDNGYKVYDETGKWVFNATDNMLTVRLTRENTYLVERCDGKVLSLWDYRDNDRETYMKVSALPSDDSDIKNLVTTTDLIGTWAEPDDADGDADYWVIAQGGEFTEIDYDHGVRTKTVQAQWVYEEMSQELTISGRINGRYLVEGIDNGRLILWDQIDREREIMVKKDKLPDE